MDSRGEHGPAEPESTALAIPKTLDIIYGDRHKLIGIIQNHDYSYNSVVEMIRTLFGNPFLNGETINLHLTPEPHFGSIIRNDDHIQIAINLPGAYTIIYVTSYFSTQALRSRFLGIDERLQNNENTMTELLLVLRDSNVFNMARGSFRRAEGPQRGSRGRALPRMNFRRN